MKIIDLLNKIANGEDVPKRIKYINSIWEYDEETKDYIHDDLWLIYSMNSIGLTEREVEIIEEETKPITKEGIEALGYACGEIQKCFTNGWNKSLENKPFKEDKKIEKLKENESIENDTGTCLRNITNKINEIIDYINNKD